MWIQKVSVMEETTCEYFVFILFNQMSPIGVCDLFYEEALVKKAPSNIQQTFKKYKIKIKD